MSSKVYVVQEINYEYNDEIYHRGNYGDSGGHPKKVFTSRADAQAAVDDLNFQTATSVELGSYGYEWVDIFHGEWMDLIPEELHEEFEKGPWHSPFHKLNPNTIRQLVENHLDLEFYSITEVELVD